MDLIGQHSNKTIINSIKVNKIQMLICLRIRGVENNDRRLKQIIIKMA